MTGNRWGASLLVFVLLLASLFSPVRADTNVFLYDASVAPDVDLAAYQSNGTVRPFGGGGFANWTPFVQKGPAPLPYPTIAISEPSFEQIGPSRTRIDGIFFVNHGQYLVPGRRALVLWLIKVPSASMRNAGEFHENLTLSMWVDWNQDNAWKESEHVLQKSVNLQNKFPTGHGSINVYYLTRFEIPDITNNMDSNNRYGRHDKDIRHLWTRAIVAYDDMDASPDGAQLFGDYEDYLVSYLVERDDHDHHGN